MNVIAEKQTEKDLEKYYELFEAKDMLTVTDEVAKVKISLGLFTLEQLEADRAMFEEKLANINAMIESINNLKIEEK